MTTSSERADAAALLAAQFQVARILAESPTLALATPLVLEAIGRTLAWQVGAIWEVDEREGALRQVARWSGRDDGARRFEESSVSRSFEPGVGLPGRVWETGEPAWIADIAEDPNFPREDEAAAAGLRGAFAFPIETAGRVLGVIEFFTADVREPDEAMLGTMASLGNQLGSYMERRRAEEEALASETLKSAVIASALDAVITMDADGRVLEFNPAAEEMFGYSREESIGREMAALIIPPGLRERHREGLARVVATGEERAIGKRLELSGMRADGSEFPVELTITRIPLEGPPVFAGYVRDISDRKLAERERTIALEREHVERRRAAFLADASAALDNSLEVEKTLDTIAGLAAPAIADRCSVDLVDEAGELEAMEPGPDETAIVVPMSVRGRTLGAITLIAGPERGPPSESEQALAEEFARRAATALENAQLYTERSHVARTLQQSLLPPSLPEIQGLELACRFLPAGEAIDVGGDFYDVFEIAPGSSVLVIGDVCGKGPNAAAVTALARYTLRAAAMRESRPSGVLRLLNEAMLSQRGDRRFCTVAYTALDLSREPASLRVSSGGHPPALLVRARGGGVEMLGSPGTLIGVFENVELHDTHAELRSGDTLVLYTDGVLEAGAPERVLIPEDLAEILGGVRDGTPEDFAREIEESVLVRQARLRDDVAILVAQIS